MRAVRKSGMQEIITYSREFLLCPIKTNTFQKFIQGFVPSSAPIQTAVVKKNIRGKTWRWVKLLGMQTWVLPALNQAIESIFQAQS